MSLPDVDIVSNSLLRACIAEQHVTCAGSRCDSCLYGCQGDQCRTYACLPVNMGYCQLSDDGQPQCQCLASMVPVVSDSCSSESAASVNCSATCTDVCENFCRHGEQCTVYNGRPRCTCDACSFGDKCEQSYCSNCADGTCNWFNVSIVC
jgi:hypothetical protein